MKCSPRRDCNSTNRLAHHVATMEPHRERSSRTHHLDALHTEPCVLRNATKRGVEGGERYRAHPDHRSARRQSQATRQAAPQA